VVLSGFPALPFLSREGSVMAQILYRIVPEGSHSYAVEVTDRGRLLHFESGFATEAEAEAWVAAQAKATRGIDQWERRPDLPRRR